mmetsp:Transcript_9468/g.18259  ORF Transcript_9468/g.18259 Transcript_9468/m.18259 type:complete len:730 (-) Transcript_9468:188-2377(-)
MVKANGSRRRVNRKVLPLTQMTLISTARVESYELASSSMRMEGSREQETGKDKYSITRTQRGLERSLKLKIKQLDAVIAVMALMSIIFAAYSEFHFFDNDYASDNVVHVLRALVSILTCFIILMILYRSFLVLELKKAKAECEVVDNLWTSGLYKQAALELGLVAIHCPPGLDNTFEVSIMKFTIEYSVDTVLTFFVLFRFYLALRVLYHYSEFTSDRAEWVLKAHGLDVTTSFVLKAYVQSKPLIGVGCVFMLCSIFWSELLLMTEKPDRETEMECPTRKAYTAVVESDLDTFWNCFWVTFVTTATVGYGEIYPYTHIGRTVAMLACILGNVYTGLLVLALQNNLDMSPEQYKATRYNCQRQTSARLYKSAVGTIKQFLKLKRMHMAFKQKYRRAWLLTSYKINAKSYKFKRSSLLPLTKVFGRRNQEAKDINVLKMEDYLNKKAEVSKLKKHLTTIKECGRILTKPGSIGQIMTMISECWDIDLSFLNRFTVKMYKSSEELKPILNSAHRVKLKAEKLKTLTAYLCDTYMVKEEIDPNKFYKVLRSRSSLKNHKFMRRRSYFNTVIRAPSRGSVVPRFLSLNEIDQGLDKNSTTTPSVTSRRRVNSDSFTPSQSGESSPGIDSSFSNSTINQPNSVGSFEVVGPNTFNFDSPAASKYRRHSLEVERSKSIQAQRRLSSDSRMGRLGKFSLIDSLISSGAGTMILDYPAIEEMNEETEPAIVKQSSIV